MRHRGVIGALLVPMVLASGLAAAAPLAVTTGEWTTAAARSAAHASATFTIRPNKRVRVSVTTDGKVVLVRYRVSGERRVVRRAARRHTVTAVLPARSRRIAVKALATKRLAAGTWVNATRAAANGPADPAPGDADPQPDPGGSGPLGDGSAAVTNAQLTRAAARRVLFGHQSVGMNILDGVATVYSDRGLAQPAVLEWPSTHPSGGFVSHAYIGENEAPLGKIADFADHVRVTDGIDVAVMKLCFVDIVQGTDAQAVFRRYRDTMADLASRRPGVALVYTTVPLTVGAGQDNAVRQRFNSLIRNEYADTGRLFDIAAVESTRPDGSRLLAGGGTYLTLNPAYASDEGHLNERGAARVAAGFLRTIAAAAD